MGSVAVAVAVAWVRVAVTALIASLQPLAPRLTCDVCRLLHQSSHRDAHWCRRRRGSLVEEQKR